MTTFTGYVLARRLLFVWVLMPLIIASGYAQTPVFFHPKAGDVYKEYSRAITGYSNWRVVDPNATHVRAVPLLPNATLAMSIDDLSGAIRAEALIDITMWHPGTYRKGIRFNGNSWIPIPDLQTTPGPMAPECYLGGYIVSVNVPLSHLKVGTNTFQGTNGGQTCYDFNWGHYGQFGIVIRVYYGSGKVHPTGSITYPTAGATLGENPTISVSTSGSVNRVDLVGYYDGYDIDGDGIYRDWQYNYHRRKTETSVDIHDHIGTKTTAPFSMTWNTGFVPDQTGMKMVARIRGTNGVWYVTDEITNLTLRRSNASVKLYKPSNVPDKFKARAGNTYRCNIVIPTTDNLANATSVKMLISTWNGTNKQALTGETGYTKINSYQFPLFGADEHWSYDVRDFPLSAIKTGTNVFTVYSSSSGYGIQVEWPGPALLVRYGQALPPAGDPTKLAFGVQPSNTQFGSTISPPVTVLVQDANGNLVTSDTRSVTIAVGTNPAGGTLSGTKTVAAVGGIATFSTLSINNAGSGYTLSASASGLTGAVSSAFDITSSTPPPPPPPTGNILRNGGFEGGAVDWKFYSNGGTGNAFAVVSDAPIAEGLKKARVTLGATVGTNSQIYQSALSLEAGKKYRLTFQAYASKATTIQARVIEQNDDYTVYGFPFRTFSLTTGWQTFTVDFTGQNFTGTVTDGMVQFYFVKSTPSTSIYFDGVVLAQEGSTPPPPPPPSGNLLQNGGFEAGITAWRYYQNGTGNSFTAVNTAPVTEGTQKARIVLGSVIGTNNQLYQNGLTLVAGTPYRLTFAAYGSKATSLRVRVIEQNDDYTAYGFPFRTITLGTSFQTFSIDFTASNFSGTVTDAMVQFYFVSSTPSTTIYLDQVVLGPATAGSTEGLAELGDEEENVSLQKEGGEQTLVPTELTLKQNYPNPFNPSTRIDYTLPEQSHVTLEVYNVLGERVAVLVDQAQHAGYFSVPFDAATLPTGVYVYRLTTGTDMLVRKMMFVK